MDIEIKITKDVNPSEAAALYREAGWFDAETPDSLAAKMISGCFAFCGAFENGTLIGMMRALSDGVSDAYILDLAVLKSRRRHGIGKKILETLTSHLESIGIDWIVCIGAPGTESFYAASNGKNMTGYTPMRF